MRARRADCRPRRAAGGAGPAGRGRAERGLSLLDAFSTVYSTVRSILLMPLLLSPAKHSSVLWPNTEVAAERQCFRKSGNNGGNSYGWRRCISLESLATYEAVALLPLIAIPYISPRAIRWVLVERACQNRRLSLRLSLRHHSTTNAVRMHRSTWNTRRLECTTNRACFAML